MAIGRLGGGWLRPLQQLYVSLPVQLLVGQMARHRGILFFWLFLFLLATGNVLADYGLPNLLLEPEYQGRVSFLSHFWVGLGIGVFILAYHLTLYIQEGPRFAFLVTLPRPFRVFAVNNSAIPLLFWVVYLAVISDYHLRLGGATPVQLLGYIVGLLLGRNTPSLLAALYFRLWPRLHFGVKSRYLAGLGTPVQVVRTVREALGLDHPARTYLENYWRSRNIPRSLHLAPTDVVLALNRLHARALVLIVVFGALLLFLGILQRVAAFQVPAMLVILLFFSIAIMVVGAVAYWFRRYGPLVILGLVVLGYYVNNWRAFEGRHRALGLSYTPTPTPYTQPALAQASNAQAAQQDSAQGVAVLEHWQKSYVAQASSSQKPLMLIITASGGGLRSATFTLACLQRLDSLAGPEFRRQWRLSTGASGGMMGLAYYRELLWQDLQGHQMATDAHYRGRVAQDVLNPITTSLITGLVIPPRVVYDSLPTGREAYDYDRGLAYERQWTENLQLMQGRRLGHYAQPEAHALLPQLILSPALVGDGRQLLISPLGVAHLCRPLGSASPALLPATDFRRLLHRHVPDSLRYTSAVRMSASFPYILPFIELPTAPAVEVMDAGALDNFGTLTAARYLAAHRHWINQHTRGVLVLQLRDTYRPHALPSDPDATFLSRLFSVFGHTYSTFARGRDLVTDEALAYVGGMLAVPLHVKALQYIPSVRYREAALNFHITQREQRDVLSSLDHPLNRQVFAETTELLSGLAKR